MTTPLDLEELKRLVAEAQLASPLPWNAEGTAVVDADGFVVLAYHRIVLALVNAIPEFIARVERAEKERDRLKAALIDCREVILESSTNETLEPCSSLTDEALLITISAALTGDTPNV